MGKTELQKDINNYEGKINYNLSVISGLKEKKINIENDKVQHSSYISLIESYFSGKREKINGMNTDGKSKSSISFIQKSLLKYSVSEEHKIVEKENSILASYEKNINKINEMISDLEKENKNYNTMIDKCNEEISLLEKNDNKK